MLYLVLQREALKVVFCQLAVDCEVDQVFLLRFAAAARQNLGELRLHVVHIADRVVKRPAVGVLHGDIVLGGDEKRHREDGGDHQQGSAQRDHSSQPAAVPLLGGALFLPVAVAFLPLVFARDSALLSLLQRELFLLPPNARLQLSLFAD